MKDFLNLTEFSKLKYQNFKGLAKPDLKLLQYTCNTKNYNFYYSSGWEVSLYFISAIKRVCNRSFSSFESILDFGCGSGRLFPFLPIKNSNVSACDIYQDNIKFIQAKFKNINSYCNALLPPLEYSDSQFDLIYSFSVFSHLSATVEDVWLREIERVLKKNGIFMATVHGDHFIACMPSELKKKAKSQGFYFCDVHEKNAGYPDYYECSTHTSSYILKKWSKYFDVLAILPGSSFSNFYCGEDIDDELNNLRPLGQDLIICKSKSTKISEYENKIQNLRNTISLQSQNIQEIYNSNSWKMTRPFRFLKNLANKRFKS